MAEASAKESEDVEEVSLEDIHAELHKEEVDEEVTDEEEGEAGDSEPEYTEEEIEAMAEGWQPDGKDKDGNSLSAQEYLARRPLFRRIKNLNEKIESLTNTVESLQEHNKISSERAIAERKRLIEELKAAKKEAYNDMDIDEAKRIDEKLEALTEEEPPAVEQPKYTKAQWDEKYQEFVDKNSWYKDNAGLAAAANDFGREFIQHNPQASPDALYKHVEEKIKENFPDSFSTRRRSTAVSTNNTRTKPKAKTTKHTFNDIPEEHRQMARVIINSGVPEEEYLKQYFMGE